MSNFKPGSLEARDVANLLHPQTNTRAHLEKGPNVIVGSDGCTIIDAAGNTYIDCVAGMWCCPIGFKSERLGKVAYEQFCKLGYYHIYKHNSHEPAINLAEKIISTAPKNMSKVIFQNSGTEANEVALKLCAYYNNALGRPERKKYIGRIGGFHGQSMATSSLSGRDEFHRGFNLPLDNRFLHTELPHYYRRHEAGETQEQFADRMAESLEKLILAEGPETIAGMFAEPVMGAAGGLMPVPTYFEKIVKILRKYEILFVADEVITGIGRTGNWWGSQTYNLQPDIMTSAKGLGAGMVPIGATIVSERVMEGVLTMSDQLGVYTQGSTFSGGPIATTVALETLKIIEEEGLIANGTKIGKFFYDKLNSEDHPMVADVQHVGAMTSMELMADRDNRKPFEASQNVLAVMNKHCINERVMVRLNSNRAIFAPSLNMTMEEAAETYKRFRAALETTWKELKA